MPHASPRDVAAAAQIVRELLDRVNRDELAAPGAEGRAAVRRLEGAALGLEAVAGRPVGLDKNR